MSKALNTKRRSRQPVSLAFHLLFTVYVLSPAAAWLVPAAPCRGQSQVENPPAQTDEAQSALATDWAPELLDAILSSPNEEAHDALYRAAFAAGPAIVPQLEAAIKDDRTAEFAAQSLAFIRGAQA